MSRILPAPWLSLFLLVVWLLLQNSVSIGLVVLGAILATAIPLYTFRARDFPLTIHRPGTAVVYFLVLLVDIVVSNIDIAKIILLPRKKIKPALIEYPLDLTNQVPITILACTITLTPGTVSAELSRDGNTLLIHALNVEDVDALIADIKQRYERRLKEIFQC